MGDGLDGACGDEPGRRMGEKNPKACLPGAHGVFPLASQHRPPVPPKGEAVFPAAPGWAERGSMTIISQRQEGGRTQLLHFQGPCEGC